MSETYKNAILNKILSEFTSGNTSSAFNDLEKFLTDYPNDYLAKYNYGYMCQQLKKIDLAKKNYLKVIVKIRDHWQSRFNLYTIYIDEKSYNLALKYINEVLEIKKNFQPTQRDKALVLHYLKKPDEGINYINSSIKQNPLDYLAFNTLGLILISLNRLEEAKKAFLNAIKLDPKYISSYNNLGHFFTLINDYESALEYFNKAFKIDPDSSEVINNLANYFLNKGNYKKALEFYLRAYQFDDANPLIMNNIAIAHFNMNNEDEAEKFYQRALSLDSSNDIIKKAYSHLLLKQQKYKEAWSIFDGRLKLENFSHENTKHNNIKNKLWKKNDIFGEKDRILVIKEQGVGDEILYGSIYSDLLKKFPQTVFEADKRLINMFEYSFNSNKNNKFFPFGYYSNDKKKLESFDAILYAGSLGKYFRNNISEFPKGSFLNVDRIKIENMKSKLNFLNNKIKIGISWKSKREHYGEYKSITLDKLLPILKIPNIDFINLQYGETKKEVSDFIDKEKIIINTIEDVDLFNDFISVSSLLKNLDLFITVSNSTAHLAGALGIPTWLIKPKNHATFFYWNQNNNETPWYSSVKIFTSKSDYKESVNKIKNKVVNKFKIKY